MRKILFVIALVWTALVSFAYRVEDVPNVHLQNRNRYLSNPDGIISPGAQLVADSIMQDIWNRTSAEVVAVVIDSIPSDTDPDSYATELFEYWGIGKSDKDNGLLFLISVNDRAAVIRTGYGIEGVVPDIVSGSILRNDVFPRFREGDYDKGLIDGLHSLHRVITTPEGAEELLSKYKSDAGVKSEGEEMWNLYLYFAVLALCVFLAIFIAIWIKNRKNPNAEWGDLSKFSLPALVCSVLFIFIPIPAYLLIRWRMNVLRNKAPKCPRCNGKMFKMANGWDTSWLNSSQLTERRLKSVDHDVWECPDCGYGLVNSFRNPKSIYQKCKKCGTYAAHKVSDTIVKHPTVLTAGTGEIVYHCEHCHDDDVRQYTIPRKQPVVVGPVGRGRGFGGGGFSGGSFGGGHTGGGGASGRW